MSKSHDSVQQDTITEVQSETSPEAVQEACNSTSNSGTDRLVPVGEAIRYRKRAQSAEQGFSELKVRFQNTQVELEQAHQAIMQLERRQKIDKMLTDADAVDLDVLFEQRKEAV